MASDVQPQVGSKRTAGSVKFKPPNIEVPQTNNGETPMDDPNSKSPVTPIPPGSAREESDRVHKEKKMGHRRVDRETGEVTYKRVPTSQLMGAIQLSIGNVIGSLAGTPKRDLLVQDFDVVDRLAFPSEGTNTTPSHSFGDFRFKCYAPIAFRYFRDLFNIKPEDFLSSVCSDPMRELSNPGASGSVFYVSQDDQFIIKTVQHKEAEFLQKLLPGYYMNLQQNPRTLLPKFFGLYCYQSLNKNVRLLAMNNLLPFSVKMHQKYDLKGSTYKRRASKHERAKPNPTLKDLDFMEDHPDGIYLEADTYDALFKTISRDSLVLESFKIMDYSLLLGIHNIDQAQKDKTAELEGGLPDSACSSKDGQTQEKPDPGERRVRRQKSLFSAWESIQVDSVPVDLGEEYPVGGLPARNSRGERLLLFVGIIDILQNYRLFKKLEHTWKSVLHDGDTISVHRPGFYAERFQKFLRETVFKKIPSLDMPEVKGHHRKFRSLVASYMALKQQSPSKKRTRDRRVTTGSSEERHRSSSHGDAMAGASTARPDLVPADYPVEDKTVLGGRYSGQGGRRQHFESGKNQLQRQEAAVPDIANDGTREKKVERLFATSDAQESSTGVTVSRHVIRVGRSMSGDEEASKAEVVYDEKQLLVALLDLLKNTKMVDFMIETYQSINDTKAEPDDLVKRREEVKAELKDLKEKTEPIVKILEDEQVAQQIQNAGDRDGKQLMDYLTKHHDFHPSMLDTLYKYAKCLYECGNYSGASEYLYFYRLLVAQHDSNYLNALWGKLASEILTQNFDVAKGDIAKLKAYIDNNPFETDLELLQERAWLIHWSLFVFFNHPKGRDDIIDMCLQSPNYLSTIQVLCPHILRYLAVAVVTNKKRKQCLKDLVKVIQLESQNYADPVTEFLQCLFVNFDFDGAQQKLRACEEVLENDFFLVACVDDFIECSRLLIFEMFCRIHQCISIKMLAEKLNMEEEEAERWIVNLIRNAQLDAKIDSTLGHVVMGTKTTSIHEQVMENTKRLSFRAQSMAYQLEKAQKEKHNKGSSAWGGQGYGQ